MDSPTNKGGLRGGFRLQEEAHGVANHLENSLATTGSPSKKRLANGASPHKLAPNLVPSNRSPTKDYIKLSLNQQFGGSVGDQETSVLDDISTNVQRILSEEIDFIPAVNAQNTLLLSIQKNCTDVSTLRVKTAYQFQCGSKKKAGMLAGGDVHRPYDVPNKSPARDGNLKAHLPSSTSPSSASSPTKKSVGEDQLPEPTKNFYDEANLRPEWQNFTGAGAGLVNAGNTCFLNATLQCLAYTPALHNYLVGDHHAQNCRISGYCITCELEKLLPQMVRARSGQPMRPHGISNNMRVFAKTLLIGRQEDAHEFLRFVVEAMRKAALTATGEDVKKLDLFTQETTFASRIFGGFYRSRVLCQTCKHPSNVYDPFLDIPLDIARVSKLEEALRAFTRQEHLNSPNNLYQCERCKKSCPATKQVTIHKAPTVLTFQLKRFLFNSFSSFSKIDKPIEYPETLNLKEFMSPGEGVANVVYRLYAVLVHSGSSCHSGHYYSYIKSGNEMWSRMDDTSVNTASKQTALSQRAYLLFYTRVPSTPQNGVPRNVPPQRPLMVPRLAPFQIHQNGNHQNGGHQNGNARDVFFPNSNQSTTGSADSVPNPIGPSVMPPIRNGITASQVPKSPVSAPLPAKITMQFVPRQIGINNSILNAAKAKKPVTPTKPPAVPTALVPYADEDDDEPEPVIPHLEPTSRGSSTSSSDSVKENKESTTAVSPKKSGTAAFEELSTSPRVAPASGAVAPVPVNGTVTDSTTHPEPDSTSPGVAVAVQPVLSKKAERKLKRRQMKASEKLLRAGPGDGLKKPDEAPVVATESSSEVKKKKKKKRSKRHREDRGDDSPVPAPVWVEKDSTSTGLNTCLSSERHPVVDSQPEPKLSPNRRPQPSGDSLASSGRHKILSWTGGKSLLSQSEEAEGLERRKRQLEETDSFDDHLDEGRSKKLKSRHFAHSTYRNGGGGGFGGAGNPFQRQQDYRTECDSRSKSVVTSRSSHSDTDRRPYRSRSP